MGSQIDMVLQRLHNKNNKIELAKYEKRNIL